MVNIFHTYLKIYLTVLIVFFSLFIYGQDHFVFEHLSTEDGLSNGTINSSFRDSNGFMWFCTDDGLCRYDGYNFKTYKVERTASSLIQNIQFISIVEDCYGQIWLGTSLGLFFYNPSSDQILSYSSLTDIEIDNSLIDGSINCLLFDSHQYLWLGLYAGIIRIKISDYDIDVIESADIEVFNFNSIVSLERGIDNVLSVVEDAKHQIWFSSSSNQLVCYNYPENKFSYSKIDLPDFEKSANYGFKLQIDSNDDLWIASSAYGLTYWDREKNEFTQFKYFLNDEKRIDIQLIRCLFVDSDNRIWIGTDGNGLIAFDKKTNEIKHFRKDIEDHAKLSSNAIYSIYEDTTGIFWIGTYLMGLNKYVSNKSNFEQINSSPYSKTGLSHNIVTSFCEDQNNQIWISTDGGGLNLFNRKTNQFKHYKHDPSNPASISTNTTMALFCDHENNIWIGTYNGGLNKFDQKRQKFQHYMHNPNDTTSISSNHPWGFAQDKSNNLWVATVDAGLNLLKPGSTSFINYTTAIFNYYGSEQIHSKYITQLFIDKNNRLWIGTEFGLDMVELDLVDFSLPKPKLIFNHYEPSDTTNSISFNRISCINEDGLNNLWIGTRGGGLNKFDKKTNLFTCFNVEDGLPHSVINGILFDQDNNPWVSTNNGLSYLNIETGKFKNYDTSDGLQSSVFVKTSYFKTSDGMFLFGGINGFNAFYPENITIIKTNLKPIITDFKLFNQSIAVKEVIDNRIILNKAIYKLDEIVLFHKENSIAFEFSALDNSTPEKVYYSYKLNGFDQDWQITDAKMRIAKYTNLSPGDYRFSVKASNNEESWPDVETSILIHIRPPWWKTLLFQISVIVLFITLWIVGFTARVYSLKKQKKILELKVEEKTQLLSSTNKQLIESNIMKDKFMSIIAHDLINPFNTILGFSDLLLSNFSTWSHEKSMASIKTINESSNNLFELLGNLLQWSRSERGLLEYFPEKINLNQCIKENVYLQSATAKTKSIAINVEFSGDNCMVKSDVHLLNAIIRNLISNAIKFTPSEGEISIRTDRKDKYMLVSVIDNGVGIDKNKIENLFRIDTQHSTTGTNDEKGTGLGLLLVKEFVTKQEGTLNIESKVNLGSTFSFTIPCWTE